MSNTNWSDVANPNTTEWLRNSGIDTSVPTYDDPTISYDDPITYYDGYDASTITTSDVKFSLWTENIPANSAWLSSGNMVAPQYDDPTISYDDPLMFYEGFDPNEDTLD